MAQNKTILVKIKDYTKGLPETQEFLGEIFQFECSGKSGWYEKTYAEILDKCCVEEGKE